MKTTLGGVVAALAIKAEKNRAKVAVTLQYLVMQCCLLGSLLELNAELGQAGGGNSLAETSGT